MENNGIYCHKGWEKLYSPIIEAIWKYDDTQNVVLDKIGIKKIISKNGKMKIIVENDFNLPSNIEHLIDEAEHKSLSVCEYCGAIENIGTTLNSNFITCCHDCWETEVLPHDSNSVWKNTKTNVYYRKKG